MIFWKRLAAAVILAATAGCSYQRRVEFTPVPEPARREVEAAGVRVAYELAGDTLSSKPTVVMLHGFGAALESWSDIHPMVAAEYPVLRLDLKGFGLSSKPRDGRYSAKDQADVVAATLRELGVKRAVLVGHSFGGAVAFATYLKLRSENDGRVVGLTFIDPGVYEQPLPFFISTLKSEFTRWLMYTFTTPDWRAETVLSRVYADDSVMTAERVQRYSRYMDLPGAHYAFEQTAEQIVPPDAAALEGLLKTIAVPTLALWGGDDRIVPVKYAYRMKADVPGVELHVLPETGHAPQEERPADTASILLSFLRRLPSGSSESPR
ncbi:MAG TPA: alpha/beta fold hydrolase [Gemmatimonadaceae bacterium]|nr:alpha/beta fold hydrolase [Gemmatimonadaceae bacterium]